jgi:hypothetical protein
VKKTRTAVVYDLHGTLADTSHRTDLAPGTPNQPGIKDSDWDTWSLACVDDTPIPGMIRRMMMDFAYHQVHICTSEGEIASEVQRAWLSIYAAGSYDYLKMRTRGDCRSGKLLKAEYILGLQADGLDVQLMYEDLKSDADYVTEMTGVPVVLVNPAYQWIEVLRDNSLHGG